MTSIPASEARKMLTKQKRRHKYNAQRVTVDGVSYDSKAEARYGATLKLREKAGEVSGVEMQRPFPLMAPNGEVVGIYKADFAFWDATADRFRVIDVKGMDTALSKHKRKHVHAQYGVQVEVVKA